MHNHGDLRIWWKPKLAVENFHVSVDSEKEAEAILKILSNYNRYEHKIGVKKDLTCAGGLEIFDKNKGWINETKLTKIILSD